MVRLLPLWNQFFLSKVLNLAKPMLAIRSTSVHYTVLYEPSDQKKRSANGLPRRKLSLVFGTKNCDSENKLANLMNFV